MNDGTHTIAIPGCNGSRRCWTKPSPPWAGWPISPPSGSAPGAFAKGVTPAEIVYEEDRLKLRHYLSDTKPKLPHAAGLHLRPGQPALHPGPQERPQRHRQLRRTGLRHLPGRLGHPHPCRPAPHAGRLHQRLHGQRDGLSARAHRGREGQRPRLLHGRHHERHVHRPASGAGQEPDAAGRAHRLRHQRGPAQRLDPGREFRRGQVRRCLRQLPAGVPPGHVPDAPAGGQPDRKAHQLLRAHARGKVHRRLPHHRKLAAGQHPGARARFIGSSSNTSTRRIS